jgi:hypothetical protein
MLPILSSEDRYGPSCVRVPVRVLPHPLVFRCFGVFAGSIFSLPTQEEGPCTPELNASSSHEPLLTAPPAASSAPTHLL